MKSAIISIVLSVLSTTTLSATVVSEPNNTGSEIKFVIDSNTPVKWTAGFGNRAIRGPREQAQVINPSPIKSTYAARIRIRDDDARFHSEDEVLDRINDSPISKKFSKSQQELLKTGFAVQSNADPKEPYCYYVIRFYAVSEKDAKLMARAYLDGLNRFAELCASTYKRDLSKWQEDLHDTQNKLSEKEAKLKACEEKYKQEKENTHKFSSHGEAYDLANDTILEMSKVLNRLEIEMVGIRAKLNAIEKYRGKTAQSDALHAKLEEMSVEQMIELSGLQARWAATESLRAKQQAFLGVYNERKDLQREVGKLRDTIGDSQKRINNMTELLAHPKPDTMWGRNLLPPKVFQNTITIHPVLTK